MSSLWRLEPEVKKEAWVYSHTGGIAHDRYWQTLEARFRDNPAGFAARHPLEVGFLTPPAMLGQLPHNPILDDLRRRHDRNPKQFEHWHNFWGHLFDHEPHLSAPPPVTSPPVTVPGQVMPPVTGPVGTQAVPEPASIVLIALAVVVVLAGLWLPRKAGYR